MPRPLGATRHTPPGAAPRIGRCQDRRCRASESGRGALPAAFVVLLLFTACSGEPQTAGEATGTRTPADVVAARTTVQRPLPHPTWNADDPHGDDQILFGDLHVHTTFSGDAFALSLPMMGGEGAHPPADACDFARFCSALDFYSINDHAEGSSPRLWDETIASIEQCNAVAGGSAEPDLVALLGWEWTQVGDTAENHWGHKNVVLREFDRARVPARPIAAPRGEFRVALLPPMARVMLPLMHFSERQRYFDYHAYAEEISAVPICRADVASPDLPRECHEVAATPSELYEKLDQWDVEALVIPHGTTWGLMTPTGFDIARELTSNQHDAGRQRLFEVYSGHGSAEEYRDRRAAVRTDDGSGWTCPAATEDFLPCCWRAGEIIRERCNDPDSESCEAAVVLARQRFVDAGVAGNRTIPGATVEDWQDCDQCRDCAVPAYSHRTGGSLQAALAATGGSAADGEPARFRFGLIGSSDTHDARGGNGFKEIGRIENTEAPYLTGSMARTRRDDREPVARSEPVVLGELELGARRYVERSASFLTTGGLVAVHADSRSRDGIWNALEARRVYGTSGERILLWFDLLNAPDGRARPMGSEVDGQRAPPRFRVTARGAFVQEPGCPDHVRAALGEARTASLCLDECYHPSDQRRTITRIEVVRIRAASAPGEPLAPLIEDPWRVLPCSGGAEGCRVEFADAAFGRDGRETIYYVRAIQEPTPAINAAGLRCERDENGRCVELAPCYGDERTSREDDCLAPFEERAWSSPIFLSPAGS